MFNDQLPIFNNQKPNVDTNEPMTNEPMTNELTNDPY